MSENKKLNCEICVCIKDSQVSNIGTGENFPDPVEKTLEKLEVLGEGWDHANYEVLKCPLCGSIYLHICENSFTGSGGSDNQYLYRAEFKADDQICRQGRGYYNDITEILSESKKKDNPEIKEIIEKIRQL